MNGMSMESVLAESETLFKFDIPICERGNMCVCVCLGLC